MVGRGNEAGTEGWHDGGESASLRQETVQLLSYAVVCFGMVAAMVARADGDYPFGGRFAVFLSLLPRDSSLHTYHGGGPSWPLWSSSAVCR